MVGLPIIMLYPLHNIRYLYGELLLRAFVHQSRAKILGSEEMLSKQIHEEFYKEIMQSLSKTFQRFR